MSSLPQQIAWEQHQRDFPASEFRWYTGNPGYYWELVFAGKPNRPTCTINGVQFNYQASLGSQRRVYESRRHRRWPDGVWATNEPQYKYRYDKLTMKLSWELKKRRAPLYHYELSNSAATNEKIEAAYGIWLSRRMFAEESQNNEQATADGPRGRGRYGLVQRRERWILARKLRNKRRD